MKRNIKGMRCPHCEKVIAKEIVYSYIGKRAGSVMTPKKMASNRANALKGGRPKGSKNKKK